MDPSDRSGTDIPSAKRLKRRVAIRLDAPTIDYLKDPTEDMGIPYQGLITRYLGDCAECFAESRTRKTRAPEGGSIDSP